MSPDEALAVTLRQNPNAVLVVATQADGSLSMLTGPDMTLEHVNFLLDQVKQYIMSRTATPMAVSVPTVFPVIAEASHG